MFTVLFYHQTGELQSFLIFVTHENLMEQRTVEWPQEFVPST
jgi:hypothetical protein